jgi:hypothetical protein
MRKHLKNKTGRKHKHIKNCTCRRKRKIKGGNNTIIPLNNYNDDPLSPSMQLSGRNTPDIKGGSKRKTVVKRIKGGNPMLYGATNNMMTNFGNYDMAYAARDLISGEALPSTDVTDQPAYLTYSKYNVPLV